MRNFRTCITYLNNFTLIFRTILIEQLVEIGHIHSADKQFFGIGKV